VGYIIHVADPDHSDRPRIGLVADRREASFGAWTDIQLDLVWTHYVDAITHAGGAPMVFPLAEAYAAAPELALDVIDGLLLAGGRDLNASSYGAEAHPENESADPLRDQIELALAAAAIERDVPTLGVCRGMQVLNVALGGGIEQHLADPKRIHRGAPGAFVGHTVDVSPDTRLNSILGDTAEVRSHHHQGVGPLAERFTASAHADVGVVEAAEVADREFCIAVLWHPEEDLPGGGAQLYEALVEAARAARIPA
jgi:putative glutamine amidotransferase